jgi:hypothetical protein
LLQFIELRLGRTGQAVDLDTADDALGIALDG